MRILVTGTAGFIGFNLARRLLREGHQVFGVDGLTPYYDVDLKRRRHRVLESHPNFRAEILRLEDAEALRRAADAAKPEIIVHLAAQAGVRHSLEAPREYVDANLTGTFNVMEAAHAHGVRHFLFASTSSVYGANLQAPFRETDAADHPLSLYAATKKAGEAMTHAYAHVWGIPTTAFRFFTVYGPWGRPDMALFSFAEAILAGRQIELFNAGQMERDFTYVDDLVEAVIRLLPLAPETGRPVGAADSLSPAAPWRAVNIGRGAPVPLMEFLAILEKALGRRAQTVFAPMQAGDMASTFASADLLEDLTGFRPSTSASLGVPAFCEWLLAYRADPEEVCARAAAGLQA
ncbi:MAG: NAD-dependent epimerase/dehydratase family protein [Caulobacteraceae bacterium]|nr:NAD-dependent epimerase/dehydratase family protein [Caulobacteraceae bacterium]